MTRRVDEDVLAVFRELACDGDEVRITSRLDRQLHQRVNKVLETLGGKWARRAQAHVFGCEAAPLIADVVSTGEYVDWRQELQFYPTLADLAARMCRLAGVGPGVRVLEPSAGRGAIAGEARQCGGVVWVIEINQDFADELREAGFDTTCGDFLQAEPGELPFDVCVMNPPFSRGRDVQHVRHAFGFVRPGGKLVAVMSPGFTFRKDPAAVEFREYTCVGKTP